MHNRTASLCSGLAPAFFLAFAALASFATQSKAQSCPSVITQSTSQGILAANSGSCNTGTASGHLHYDNSYWRVFDMATFTSLQQYDVTSVSFGIQDARRPRLHDSTRHRPPV